MSADRTHVEVVEDGDEFSVDLHDGEGEDRETVRVVTYATLAEANGLRELIAVWIRSEQDRYYALGYDRGRQGAHPLTQEERDAREIARLTARIAQLEAALAGAETSLTAVAVHSVQATMAADARQALAQIRLALA